MLKLLILVLAVGLSIWGYRGESAKLRTGGGGVFPPW